MHTPVLSRRELLKTASCGFGYMAFAGLAAKAVTAESSVSSNPLAPKPPHFPAKAKHIIFLCMHGGPSHIDTFDFKPLMRDGTAPAGMLACPWKFSPQGQSGLPICELFPNVSKHADSLCIINSMQTSIPNHLPAYLMLHTGDSRLIRPSMGAWLLYGLGSENDNLPGFVTINPPLLDGGAQNYGSAFLPSCCQATRIGEEGSGVAGEQASLANLTSIFDKSTQRRQLNFINDMNRELVARNQVDPAVEGEINSFELGFRMQGAYPRVLDLSKESRKTLEMYGITPGGVAKAQALGSTDVFGRQCLMARRMVEAGVRFVEIGVNGWDMHVNLVRDMPVLANSVDQPIAALLTDLKQRGMMDDTIVMWGGEFGRSPKTRAYGQGRDHNAAGFTMWLAGAGIKPGQRVGATDETGMKAVENPVHHHDLHATLLHLFGLDHRKLIFRHGGRDNSLTDIHGRVVKEILA